ncbi:hypothetical protein ACIPEN_20455 [Herbaspirillum chlorophenolicum]|uniref:Uncharacterized protein n=1 Tax=Herbaspirillum chlorophenolicum TaxID=211589 RepID=A0ABW8F4J0_9BURK
MKPRGKFVQILELQPGMASRKLAGKERQTMKQLGNAVPARHGALMQKDDWKAFFQKITI